MQHKKEKKNIFLYYLASQFGTLSSFREKYGVTEIFSP